MSILATIGSFKSICVTVSRVRAIRRFTVRPVLPEALTAILEGRTTPVSSTAFDFISTAAQIGDIRSFMRKLPDILSR